MKKKKLIEMENLCAFSFFENITNIVVFLLNISLIVYYGVVHMEIKGELGTGLHIITSLEEASYCTLKKFCNP